MGKADNKLFNCYIVHIALMIDIHISSDSTESAQLAGKKLTEIFRTNKEVSILFLVSGGSALKILTFIDSTCFDSRVTVGVLDERFSTDPAVNNFAQLSQTDFYKKITEKNCHVIHTMPFGNETPGDLATRWEQSLRDWKNNHPDGVTVITQGIGPDGHTAGIMPYAEEPEIFKSLFEDFDAWIVAYDAEGKTPYRLRVTTTIPFLLSVDVAVVYVCGLEKLDALKKTLAKEGSLAATPARVIQQMKHVSLFTDLSVSV